MPTMLKRSLRSLAACAALAALLSPAAGAQVIRTVNAAGPGGPGPWATSVASLPAALAASMPGDEVWIAAGTYAASTSAGFVIPSNVRIFGGFAGTETSRSDRAADPLAHRVTLTAAGCFHILNFNNTGPQTSLDRLRVTSGQSQSLYSTVLTTNANGPCVFATTSSLSFSDCVFVDSASSLISYDYLRRTVTGGHGGCAYLTDCNSSFERCTFQGNSTAGSGSGCALGTTLSPSPSGSGGALYISGGSARFADCDFLSNQTARAGNGQVCATGNTSNTSAAGEGGAIFASNVSLSLTRSRFSSNSAGSGAVPGYTAWGFYASAPGGGGGAIFVQSGQLAVDSCSFSNNSAGNGADGGSFGPTSIQPGSAGGAGGAIRCTGSTSIQITNSVFWNNRAGAGGSGINGTPQSRGGNGGTGAAIYSTGAADSSVINCTFVSNIAGVGGAGTPAGVPGASGGVDAPGIAIINSILWSNSAAQYSGTSSLSNNCIQTDPSGPYGTNADPMFVNAATGDYHLLPGSPCINAGNSSLVNFIADVDLDGRPRFVDSATIALAGPVVRPAIDIGAYEFQFAPPDCTFDGIADIRQIGGNTLLTPTDTMSGQRFGWAGAISADFVAIGARAKDTVRGLAAGQVSVYDRAGSSFGRVTTLIPPDGAPGDDFGNQVALGGSWLAVGARFGDIGAAVDAGAAYVWRRDGLAWTYGQKLAASDSHTGDEFAHGLAIDGSAIIAGALLGDAPGATNSGAAYVFRLGSTGTWAQEANLVAGDAATGDGFGISVGVSGTTAVIGAPYRVEGGVASGVAYIFDFDGTTWTQTAKLVPSGAGAGDTFGELVVISGDTILVNSPRHTVNGRTQAGAVYAFQRTAGVWAPGATLASNAPQAGELFGFGLALRGNTAIVGAFSRSSPSFGARAGAAYVFRHVGAQWRLADRIDNPEPGTDAFFGYSVALSDTQFVVGAMQQNVRGVAQVGAARVFDLAILDSNRNGIPDSCDIASGLLIDADGDGIPDTIPSGLCRADFNENGTLNAQDIFDYLGAWFASDPRADFNGVNGLNAQDIFDYLAAWFAGC